MNAASPRASASVSMAEFEKALDDMIFRERESADAALTGKPYGHLRVAFHESRAEVLRLASAGVKPSVSREALVKALRNNYSPDVTPEDIVEMALRALNIKVTE